MRILLLTREYPPHVYGGAGVVVDHLSRALARRAGGRGALLRRRRSRREPRLTIRGYAPWHRLAGGPEAPYAPALEALSVGLAMARDPVAADVVHTHTWYVGLGGMLVQPHLRRAARGHAPQHGAAPAVEGRSARHRLRGVALGRAPGRGVAPTASSRCRPRCAGTSWPTSGSTLTRVVVIHNGVDAELSRAPSARDALARHGVRAPYVLFVGRISEQKGIFQLLEAAAGPAGGRPARPVRRAARTRRSCEARLERRGGGPPRDPLDQRDAAGARGRPALQSRRGLRLPVDLRAVRPDQPRGDGLRDPGGRHRVGGIPEVVVDGETGRLVAPGESAALGQALRETLADPERARRIGGPAAGGWRRTSVGPHRGSDDRGLPGRDRASRARPGQVQPDAPPRQRGPLRREPERVERPAPLRPGPS